MSSTLELSAVVFEGKLVSGAGLFAPPVSGGGGKVYTGASISIGGGITCVELSANVVLLTTAGAGSGGGGSGGKGSTTYSLTGGGSVMSKSCLSLLKIVPELLNSAPL